MARFLLDRVETYRVDTEVEVKDFIEEMKQASIDEGFVFKSWSSTFKEKKSKGEVIDECYQVKIAKSYDSMWEC